MCGCNKPFARLILLRGQNDSHNVLPIFMNVKLENSLVCGVIFLFVCTMRCEHNCRSALRQGPLPREERPRGVGGFAQGEEPQCSQRPFTCHGLLAMRHAPCPPILVPVLVEPGKCNLKIAIFGAPITSGAGGGVMAQPPKPPPWESKCPTSQTAHSTPGEETAQTKIIHDIKKDHQISTNKKKPTSLSLVKLSHCPDCPTTAPRFLTIKKVFSGVQPVLVVAEGRPAHGRRRRHALPLRVMEAVQHLSSLRHLHDGRPRDKRRLHCGGTPSSWLGPSLCILCTP